jgi:hypothetical protein
VWRHEESRHNNILPQDQNTCRSPAVQIATGQNICCPYSIPHVDLLFYPRFNNRWTVRANKRRTHRFRLHPVQKESSFQHAYKKPFKVSSKIQHDYGELIQYLQFDMLIRNHSCLYRTSESYFFKKKEFLKVNSFKNSTPGTCNSGIQQYSKIQIVITP